MNSFDFKTGDLILFDNEGCNPLSFLIKLVTRSEITHIAMILKDPDFIDPPLKGYYVWESNYEGEPDPQDDKVKCGVQITPLDEICDKYKEDNSSIYVRSINCSPVLLNTENLKEVHSVVYDKEYDYHINDVIEAIERKDNKPQKTDRFWCSALVGYIYTNCGILNKGTDWSILRPSDFTPQYSSNLNFNVPNSLGPMIKIL
jgi:hypothetical protein